MVRKLRRSTYANLLRIVTELIGPPGNPGTAWWWYWTDLRIAVVHSLYGTEDEPEGSQKVLGPVGAWCVGHSNPNPCNTHKHTLFTAAGRKAFKRAVLAAKLRGVDRYES